MIKSPCYLALTTLVLALSHPSPAHGQAYHLLHEFDAGLNQTGNQARSPLVQGADGSLYGTVNSGGNSFGGGVFQIQPNGSGFHLLKKFTDNADGSYPYGGLAISGTTLYGVASGGGTNYNGTIFKMNTDGTGFTVLYNFSSVQSDGSFSTNSDGAGPLAGLIVSGSTLYGTTPYGGTNGGGTVFKLNSDGTGFTVLRHLDPDTDGGYSEAPLLLAGATLYGTTTSYGGQNGGTVFKVNTDGTGFGVLLTLGDTNGYHSYAPLVLAGANLLGATYWGGAFGNGVVFQVGTNGVGFPPVHSFAGTSLDANNNWTNSEGAQPYGGLILSGSTLYGTTWGGGPGGSGTVFQMNVNGSGFSVLKNFSELVNGANADGANPYAGLLLSGSTLYGTTLSGSQDGQGSLFSLNVNGTGYKVLVTFAGSDGESPEATLVLAPDGYLYGTAMEGGSQGVGTLYRIGTNGSGFAVLKHFGDAGGAYPGDTLVLSGTQLYGTAANGGSRGYGTVFTVNTDGTGFTVLTNFPPTAADPSGIQTNGPGASPAAVILSGTTLYGVTYSGGNGGGVVFKMQTDGSGLTPLKSFGPTVNNDADFATNRDGARPENSLVLSGGTLYGVTYVGGTNGAGTVFSLSTNGTGFTVLHHLGTNDGGFPWAPLVVSGDTLYGTAAGGDLTDGAVFSLKTNGAAFTLLKWFGDGYYSGGVDPIGGVTLSGTNLYGTTYQSGGVGTIFKMGTDGTGFTVLKSFNGPDGGFSRGGLTVQGNTLYGTAVIGGAAQSGVIYSLSLAQPLITSATAANGLLTLVWDSFLGATYQLQYTASLAPPNWITVPGDISSQGVTTTASDTLSTSNRFYRVIVKP